jgi:lysozyme
VTAKVYPSPRRCNRAGRDLIQGFEKCRLTCYPDPITKGDPWTIGWGETGPGIVRGLVWTQEYADHRFELALSKRERTVERLVSVPLTDNEFAALVSFEYNTGALAGSTLLRQLNAGKPRSEIAEEFRKWVFVGGRVVNGLIRRRAAERDLFLAPDC